MELSIKRNGNSGNSLKKSHPGRESFFNLGSLSGPFKDEIGALDSEMALACRKKEEKERNGTFLREKDGTFEERKTKAGVSEIFAKHFC